MVRTATLSAHVPAPPARVAALLLEAPSPALQARVGIADYRREGPDAWSFTQQGRRVRSRVASRGPEGIVLELDREGQVQRQAFTLQPGWRGGTRVTLTVELAEDAPLLKVRAYLARTLALLRERAREGPAPPPAL